MYRATSQKAAKINPEKRRGLGHVTPKFWRIPKHICKTRTARDFKFGIQMQSGNISKTAKKNPEKARGLGHVTPINFGVHPNLSPKRDELET